MTSRFFESFAKSESGAVVVDWVVLTAAMVGLGLAVMVVVSGGVENLSTDVAQELANAEPAADPFPSNTNISASSDTAAN